MLWSVDLNIVSEVGTDEGALGIPMPASEIVRARAVPTSRDGHATASYSMASHHHRRGASVGSHPRFRGTSTGGKKGVARG